MPDLKAFEAIVRNLRDDELNKMYTFCSELLTKHPHDKDIIQMFYIAEGVMCESLSKYHPPGSPHHDRSLIRWI